MIYFWHYPKFDLFASRVTPRCSASFIKNFKNVKNSFFAFANIKDIKLNSLSFDEKC